MSGSGPSSWAAATAANRFGLGARPGDLAAAGGDPQGWLRAQLTGPASLPESKSLRSSSAVLAEAIDIRRERRESTDAVALARRVGEIYRPVYLAEATARFAAGVRSDRPFLERLTHFWSNHFAVSVDKIAVLGLAGAMEREAIRPNILGSFTDLLLAVETHPAMILYLDNQQSAGAHSQAAGFLARRGGDRRLDINENLAREILELHTLGVDGGYTQADVTAFAQVITGWSVGGRVGQRSFDDGEPGTFHFRAALHEPGAKTVLGRRYADDGFEQGKVVLADLARRPETARHLATKLARHFIADDPPAAAVDRLTRAWLDSDGNLAAVYRALVAGPEAWAQPLAKFKTPSDYIYSTWRALDLPVDDTRRSLAPFELLGQRSFSPGSPAGWADRAGDWDGPSAILKRIEWADAVGQRLGDSRNARALAPAVLGGTLSASTATAIARGESGAQALTLMLAAPEFMRR